MRIDKHTVMITLFFTIFMVVCLASSTVHAQSSDVTTQSVSIPPALLEGPVPGGLISGYVFDEDGNGVPGAVVTLWQDGRRWQPGKFGYVPGDNPQTTNIAYNNEGSFIFGFIYPGQYTLTTEKDGYKGSAIVNVGNETLHQTLLESTVDTVMANITLSGYHVPVLSPEQLSYTGAITGTLLSASGIRVTGVNISLWQDGQLVKRPDNPQSSFERNFSGIRVDYLFEHLTPGRYKVMAEYYASNRFNDSVYVDVGIGTVTADIVLSHVFIRPTSIPATSTPAPQGIEVTISPSDGTKPIPALQGLIVMSIIGIIAYIMYKRG